MLDHDLLERLGGLAEAAVLDSHADMARSALGSDVALATLLGPTRQGLLGLAGLDGPPAAERATPIEQALCDRVRDKGAEIVDRDLRASPETRDHPAVVELGAVAYAGVPLRLPDGTVVGGMCVIHRSPRDWEARDLELLRGIGSLAEQRLAAALVSTELALETTELRTRLTVLGHELGNALSMVLNGITTARRGDVRPELRERLLDTAEERARTTSELLDAVLRTDARAATRLADVDVDEVLREIADRYGSGDRVVATSAGLHLRTDPVLLRHVVDNLVDNAVKYGGPTVTLSSSAPAAGGVRIDVHDDGPGLDPAALRQLFVPYVRLQTGGTGYGLGLFIVRELLARLGGEIEADVTDGTRLSLRVPDLP